MLDSHGSFRFEVGPVKYRYNFYIDPDSKSKILDVGFQVLDVDLEKEDGSEICKRVQSVDSLIAWGTGYDIFNPGKYPYQVLATVIKITQRLIQDYKPDCLRFKFRATEHARFWTKLVAYVNKQAKISIEYKFFGEIWIVST